METIEIVITRILTKIESKLPAGMSFYEQNDQKIFLKVGSDGRTPLGYVTYLIKDGQAVAVPFDHIIIREAVNDDYYDDLLFYVNNAIDNLITMKTPTRPVRVIRKSLDDSLGEVKKQVRKIRRP